MLIKPVIHKRFKDIVRQAFVHGIVNAPFFPSAFSENECVFSKEEQEQRLDEVIIDCYEDHIVGIDIDGECGWPREPAMEYGIPVGTLACPHCGMVSSGAIDGPNCSMCEQPYWKKEIK